MRILLLADIHANWAALQALDEPHDVCVCLGDLVDYGLEPAPCVDWVRRHARYAVRGNHDHGVAQAIPVSGRNGYRYLTAVTRPLSQEGLRPEDRKFLTRLPVSRTVTIDGVRFLLVHATPRDPLDEYAFPDEEFWARRLQHVEADVVCVGHTHHPYVLPVGNKVVVNPGSVGQPRDGNPEASYALIEGRHIQLKRREYPIEEAVEPIRRSPLPDPAKAQLIEVLRNGTLPKPPGNGG